MVSEKTDITGENSRVPATKAAVIACEFANQTAAKIPVSVRPVQIKTTMKKHKVIDKIGEYEEQRFEEVRKALKEIVKNDAELRAMFKRDGVSSDLRDWKRLTNEEN